ncbi:RidA family protein [uncultured Azohydromonas sp.]|jgi:Putative translation initiation inhibitor, yjgF family|uniref:RidA family protein n=1 Tax=uncultured Azohydromonas sp. TaxID=487342 RepID=UPI0026379404|nr:RidA family protein [uncultured Azohydromonas sp.]
MNRSPRSIDLPGLAHKAPIPQAARVGPLLCSSGIAGKDPTTGELPADAAAQAANAFANMDRLLEAGGARLEDVAKLTVYLKDPAAREAVNAQWLRRFPDPHDRPARHILEHDLQHGMALQLEFLAFVHSPDR